jgi:hypothetical protein
MSFYGDLAAAKAAAMHGSLQIDGLEPGDTSPVQNGGSGAGVAPMEGKQEFSHDRTRMRFVGNQDKNRREYPTEGVTKKG